MTPDPSRRPSNLTRAARANPEPVYLQTGRFAPPHARAIWQLPTPADNIVLLTWYEATGDLTARVLTGEEGGAL